MDQETLKSLMMMNITSLAKEQYNCPQAGSTSELRAGDWGTDMNSMSQVFYFTLTLHEGVRSVQLTGHACLSEWPGANKPPEVTGRAGEWDFKFCL